MTNARTLFCAIIPIALLATARVSAAQPVFTAHDPPSELIVAVLESHNSDRQLDNTLSRSLADELSGIAGFRLKPASEIRAALDDLDIQPSSDLRESTARRLALRLSADRLVVETAVLDGDRVTASATVLDGATGAPIPGAIVQAEGDRADVDVLGQRLARRLARVLGGLPESRVRVVEDRPAPRLARAEEGDTDAVLADLRRDGLVPTDRQAEDPLTERDLDALVHHVAGLVPMPHVARVATMRPMDPVSRIRVVTALVRVMVAASEMPSFRRVRAEEIVPDVGDVPMWGLPYAAAAVGQGWWSSDRPLRPRATATWAFAASIVTALPIHRPRRIREPEPEEPIEETHYTGLVIDARDFPLQRTMGPRIVDEDGEALYPNKRNVPDPDSLQDRGMADYCVDPENVARAGRRPLVIHAIGVTGPGQDDVVISNESADRIRAAERRCRFLDRWAVCILVQ